VFTELLPKNSILSFGKIRASYAQVGKDADAHVLNTRARAVATVTTGFLGSGDDWTSGIPTLKPEIQTQYELGTELRFFNGRLTLDYTYYQSETVNQISAPRLAQSTGYIFITLNGGSVTNKGMEFSITAKPIVKKDFEWETTLNLSGNRNRLGKFVDGVDIFYVTDAQNAGARVGSIPNGGYFSGLIANKYTREREQGPNDNTPGPEIPNGRYIITPTTGLYLPTTTNSEVVGNREPKMIGGFNNSITYKNLNFSFLLDLRYGGIVYNGTEYYLTGRGMSMRTLERDAVTFTGVVNKGTAGKPVYEEQTITYEAGKTYMINGAERSGKYMIQQYWTTYQSNAYHFMTETNWIRLRSISLSYNFKDLIKKQSIIKGLSATVTGSNLFLLTNYKGMDPEAALSGAGTGGSGSVGMEYCGVPATSGISFGLNLTF
jgi:outer membrane receptor protein involved in Fe transport